MKRLAFFSAFAVLVGLLGGCVTVQPTGTYVDVIQPSDDRVIATAIIAYIRSDFPPPRTTLALVPPQADQLQNTLTPTLTMGLKEAGYALANLNQNDPHVHRVAYQVTQMDGGFVLRLTIDGHVSSQFFVRNTEGALQPAAPFAVKEAS